MPDEMVFFYRGKLYPSILKKWGMSKYIYPIAADFCHGMGVDVGAGKDPFPGAIPIDIALKDGHSAMNLPVKDGELDYVFSSHCLEHVDDFVGALEHWIRKLKNGGRLFLYLPAWECEYWRPWNNRKHKHQFEPIHIKDCFQVLGLKNVLVSGVDMAHSFSAVGFKVDSVALEKEA
jgi:SAM-dependent methyltransferase